METTKITKFPEDLQACGILDANGRCTIGPKEEQDMILGSLYTIIAYGVSIDFLREGDLWEMKIPSPDRLAGRHIVSNSTGNLGQQLLEIADEHELQNTVEQLAPLMKQLGWRHYVHRKSHSPCYFIAVVTPSGTTIYGTNDDLTLENDVKKALFCVTGELTPHLVKRKSYLLYIANSGQFVDIDEETRGKIYDLDKIIRTIYTKASTAQSS